MDQFDISRRSFLFGRKFIGNASGATAIEYGLIGALISVAIIGGATQLGNRTRRTLNCTNQTIRTRTKGKSC